MEKMLTSSKFCGNFFEPERKRNITVDDQRKNTHINGLGVQVT